MKAININRKEGKDRNTIIFIHGNSSSSVAFEPLFNSSVLSAKLVSFDLPGHGRSYRADGSDSYSFQEYVDILLEIISQEEEIILVGNSLGGHVAIEAINRQKIDGLKGLIIFGAPPVKQPLNVDEALVQHETLNYLFTEDVSEAQLDEMAKVAVANGSAIEAFKQDFRETDPKIRSMLQIELAAGTAFSNEAEVFMNMEIPRLILHGAQDPYVNGQYLEEIVSGSTGDAQFKLINNCGHYPSLEQPGVLTEHISALADKVFSRHNTKQNVN